MRGVVVVNIGSVYRREGESTAFLLLINKEWTL